MYEFGWAGRMLAATCGVLTVDAVYQIGMWLLARVVCGEGD